MWRPEGWKNPYPKTGETLGMFALYEAGADAILEALKKRCWSFDRWETITGDGECITNLREKGKVVFIPDGDE